MEPQKLQINEGYCVYPERYSSIAIGETYAHVQGESLKAYVTGLIDGFFDSPITNSGGVMDESLRPFCQLCNDTENNLIYLMNFLDNPKINQEFATVIERITDLRHAHLLDMTLTDYDGSLIEEPF